MIAALFWALNKENFQRNESYSYNLKVSTLKDIHIHIAGQLKEASDIIIRGEEEERSDYETQKNKTLKAFKEMETVLEECFSFCLNEQAEKREKEKLNSLRQTYDEINKLCEDVFISLQQGSEDKAKNLLEYTIESEYYEEFLNVIEAWIKEEASELDKLTLEGKKVSDFVKMLSSSIAALTLILISLISVIITRSITKPIKKLTNAAVKIGKGSLDTLIAVNSKDEFGILEKSFSQMTQNLKSLMEKEKQSAASAAKERDRLDITLRSIGDGVIATDSKGRILIMNNLAEELTGWTQKEAQGMIFHDIFNIINERTRSTAENPVDKALESGSVVMLENDTVLIAKDGTERIIADSAAPIIDNEGAITGVIMVFRDFTERKHTEQQLKESEAYIRQLIEHSPIAMLIDVGADEDEKVLIMNKKFTQLFGYTIEDVPDVKHWWTLAYPDENYREQLKKEWIERVNKAIKTHGEIEPMEAVVTCKDGSTRYIRFYMASIGYRNLVAFENLTERKMAEDKLLELNKNLEKIVEQEVGKRRQQEQLLIQQSKIASMGEMLGAIAHQWRQPLNVVSALLMDLKDAYNYDEITKEYADDTVSQAMDQMQFMSRTIDDFRNFFKPSKDRVAFNIIENIQQVESLIRPQLRNQDIALNILYGGLSSSGVYVDGYPNEFKQVLINIINNAKDALIDNLTALGEIEIAFRTEDGNIAVTIEDNGGGIDGNIIGQVFEPYFTTKDEKKGMGIGLYMSKIIIEDNMNGRLYVENTAKGAMFTIELKRII
ncbi:PAS sensor protein [Candidatus Magnetoovum chiemensis]|nr:PAS sensor protein [Candidatus Magnetoovum chiemensis]